MREAFKTINFRGKSLWTIDEANRIIEEYQADDMKLTLRQLYYQFVARDLIPNAQREYKKLGETISNARLAGLIDWDAIEDRTRNLEESSHWTNPASIIRSAAYGYAIDKWEGQPVRVEVWIEKEALVGVIESVCQRLDVPFFACRGYVSQSEQYSAEPGQGHGLALRGLRLALRRRVLGTRRAGAPRLADADREPRPRPSRRRSLGSGRAARGSAALDPDFDQRQL